MRFATPEYLYLLVLVPLLLLVYLYSNYRRRKRLKEYGDADLLKELMPDVSAYRPNVKFWHYWLWYLLVRNLVLKWRA